MNAHIFCAFYNLTKFKKSKVLHKINIHENKYDENKNCNLNMRLKFSTEKKSKKT